MSLFGGKDRIDLRYFGAGHTNGDAVIVFPALRTARDGRPVRAEVGARSPMPPTAGA